MDFFQVCTREVKGVPELYPDFKVGRSKDLMVRGRGFYAIWDEEAGLWSTDEYDVQRLVDEKLQRHAEEAQAKTGVSYNVKYLRSFSSNGWSQFRKFMLNISDNSHQLDDHLTFANTEVKKNDYVSKRLPYPLESGDHSAWDELIGTLYSVEERAKIEWAIGAVVSGDSKRIQKFLVLYGPAGTGKSTVLNIVQKLFEGYTTSFEAKALGSNNNSFATEAFKDNPLVAIQHDGDLSKIEDNTKLNSIVSHEDMTMNEKYKPSYTARVNAFLFMGTNQPVKISDAKSGIIRRLIDVHPTGVKIPAGHYQSLMSKIEFETGAIAKHCLDTYREMGKNYYNSYRPLEMMLQTDVFFNFIEANFDIFKEQDGVTLKQAYSMYKEFCNETGVDRIQPQYKVREELRNYFDEFRDRTTVDGVVMRSYYSGFNANKFKAPDKNDTAFSLVIEETHSIFDNEFAEQPAQYATEAGTPKERWSSVKTTLSEIDTSQVHFVKVPENHIVIDFDLRDEDGGKSLERNLRAASSWPATYAELSKSGGGVHLHYNWTGGDVSELALHYSEGIEVKSYTGNASLRRAVTRCNNVPFAELNSGLPIKEKKVLPTNTIKSEKGLRDLIERNLRKEIHPGTKSSVDFIHKILEEAHESGMPYDVSDMRPKVLAFANNSTNQPLMSLKTVQKMKWQSEEPLEQLEAPKDDKVALFDLEVFPNLFIVCWKYEDSDTTVRMLNPTPQEVEALFKLKLVGYNCRRYDNHILYARYMGYDNAALYKLSKKIIEGSVGSMFGEAYGLSYTDIYDFASEKKSLKKWEIELGIKHVEMPYSWDEDLPEDKWEEAVDYCANDVEATEVVWKHRKQDFVARQILADLSGLTVNDTTQKHTARIIFGKEKNPQRNFIYTDLSKEFDGYVYDYGKSTYRGETVGEGGYVYAEPSLYLEDVALLDVASMHPTSIIQLDLFGEYTPRFAALLEARLAIKSGDYESAKGLLNGALAPYLGDPEDADALSHALKIVINIVYGLTAAKFDNPFKDPRNIDNIVAKRGALFMIDLKNAVQEKGYTVAHIKTDSIKIPGATPEIIEFVMNFGKKYGYTFEHEATYDRMCLVNDAVYIAHYGWAAKEKKINTWEAVGAQFQHPYVFKSLFSNEKITFEDMCETKQVSKGYIYLDFDGVHKPMHAAEGMRFVGKTGRFVPVTEKSGGGILYRVHDEKYFAVTGTKNYLWLEAEAARGVTQDNDRIEIDHSYFENLVEDSIKTINSFGSFEEFIHI